MKRKVLLMGRSGSGKTSMRSIIFDNVVARDTRRLGTTMEVDTSQIRFLGDLQLDLWDCGGQNIYMDQYTSSRQETIFREVHTLIYIFDVTATTNEDMVYFSNILAALRTGSGQPPASPAGSESESQVELAGNPGPMVHILIHKMDLIPPEKRAGVFDQRALDVRSRSQAAGWDNVNVFSTSIWDETLYTAWSEIVSSLNPHVANLSHSLTRFAHLLNASEVVLFERTTMLVISQSSSTSRNRIGDGDANNASAISTRSGSGGLTSPPPPANGEAREDWPEDRFAKISQAIKLFRVGCKRLKSEFASMEVEQHTYTAIFESFTPKTYILVVRTGNEPVDTPRLRAAIEKSRPIFASQPGVSLASY